MTADQLRQFVKRQPFEPFTIDMADGNSFKVTYPEAILLPPDWSVGAIVGLPKDRFSYVYLKNVTDVSSRGPYPHIVQRRRRDEDSEE